MNGDLNQPPFDKFKTEELEDLAVIQELTFVYGLGWYESEKKFQFIHDFFTTEPMSIPESVVFLRSFEERYKNEIWLRRGFYERNKAIVRRRLQSSAGKSWDQVGGVHGPDNERPGGEGH
jgi:hypothetical protein